MVRISYTNKSDAACDGDDDDVNDDALVAMIAAELIVAMTMFELVVVVGVEMIA